MTVDLVAAPPRSATHFESKLHGGAIRTAGVALIGFFLLAASSFAAPHYLPQPAPAGWDALVKEFVTPRHRVEYARFKKSGWGRLQAYLAVLSRPGAHPLSPPQKKALLINAYNAFTIDWILENYPTAGIRHTANPFTVARFTLGGQKVSLDQIEMRLRAMRDPRIHAAIVCAGISCPPLRREAYVAGRLNAQLDDNVRDWLADRQLNRFYPRHAKAEISSIFMWYSGDFDAYPGGLQGFLHHYAPQGVASVLKGRRLDISYLPYNWNLNDSRGSAGRGGR